MLANCLREGPSQVAGTREAAEQSVGGFGLASFEIGRRGKSRLIKRRSDKIGRFDIGSFEKSYRPSDEALSLPGIALVLESH